MPAARAYRLSAGSTDEPTEGAPRRPDLRLVDGADDRREPERRRALVVDDEPAMRLLFRVNLTMSGYDVVEAGDAHEAVAEVRRTEFDVILLDVMMPDVSGFELAEQLRAGPATAHIPFVFVSARADEADISRGLALGAADYIVKPFDPLTLGVRLDTILDGADGA